MYKLFIKYKTLYLIFILKLIQNVTLYILKLKLRIVKTIYNFKLKCFLDKISQFKIGRR